MAGFKLIKNEDERAIEELLFEGVDFEKGSGAKERVWERVEAHMLSISQLEDDELNMLAAAGQPRQRDDF